MKGVSVSAACCYFGYSRAGFYDWQVSRSHEAVMYDQVLDLVRDQRRVHPRIGGRKLFILIQEDLDRLGLKLGRDKFFALLRHSDLLVSRKKKYAVTTQSFMRFSQFDDLYNGKVWTAPNQAWVSDITYIRVEESFSYLFLITDAYSRKIVGWWLGQTLEAKWGVEALKIAIRQSARRKGIIHHSDRGFQYCSKQYIQELRKSGAFSSMGEAGNCYDNAMAERVNGILKMEYLLDATFSSQKEANHAVRHAVSAYNDKRPHMSLAMKKPSEVHSLAAFSSLKRKGSPSQKPVKAR